MSVDSFTLSPLPFQSHAEFNSTIRANQDHKLRRRSAALMALAEARLSHWLHETFSLASLQLGFLNSCEMMLMLVHSWLQAAQGCRAKHHKNLHPDNTPELPTATSHVAQVSISSFTSSSTQMTITKKCILLSKCSIAESGFGFIALNKALISVISERLAKTTGSLGVQHVYCLPGGTKMLLIGVSTHAEMTVHHKHPFDKLCLGNQLMPPKNLSVNIAK